VDPEAFAHRAAACHPLSARYLAWPALRLNITRTGVPPIEVWEKTYPYPDRRQYQHRFGGPWSDVSRSAPPMLLPGIASAPRHHIPPRGIGDGSGRRAG